MARGRPGVLIQLWEPRDFNPDRLHASSIEKIYLRVEELPALVEMLRKVAASL